MDLFFITHNIVEINGADSIDLPYKWLSLSGYLLLFLISRDKHNLNFYTVCCSSGVAVPALFYLSREGH